MNAPTPALTEAGVKDLRDWVTKNGLPVDPIVVALCDYWLASASDGWRPIETAPRDVEVILGWWSTWPNLAWQVAAGLAGSTKGGWIHGHATHWRPLPPPPVAIPQREQCPHGVPYRYPCEECSGVLAPAQKEGGE